jgi:hypothetical protein
VGGIWLLIGIVVIVVRASTGRSTELKMDENARV